MVFSYQSTAGFICALSIAFLISSFAWSKSGTAGLMNQLSQMDPLGALCLFPGVVCLLLALQWGGTTYA